MKPFNEPGVSYENQNILTAVDFMGLTPDKYHLHKLKDYFTCNLRINI